MLKVIAGGKVKASQTSPLTTRLPPGLVDVELSGSADGQPFAKRAQITLDPAQKHQEHTITVGKGTVQIRSFPASHVKIDGVPKGDTPLPVTLYEGEHVVQFECDRQTSKCTGLSDATKPVTVQAGKTVVLSHQWK